MFDRYKIYLEDRGEVGRGGREVRGVHHAAACCVSGQRHGLMFDVWVVVSRSEGGRVTPV